MRAFLSPFTAILAGCAVGFSAVNVVNASQFEVVNPDEEMVYVEGLAMGASRISTVEFCQETNGIKDWKNLMTDEEFELMEGCLLDHE